MAAKNNQTNYQILPAYHMYRKKKKNAWEVFKVPLVVSCMLSVQSDPDMWKFQTLKVIAQFASSKI